LFGHGKKIMKLPPTRNLHQSGPEPRYPDPQQKSSRVRELRSFAFPCGNVNADRSLVFGHDGFFRCVRLLPGGFPNGGLCRSSHDAALFLAADRENT